jgi:hypothetical protein
MTSATMLLVAINANSAGSTARVELLEFRLIRMVFLPFGWC